MYSNKTIHHQELPHFNQQPEADGEMTKFTTPITEFNSLVWNKKKETVSKETGKPLSLKDPIDIPVPDQLTPFRKDLEEMHNLQK
jgi:valyl-tRNA synthetase